MGMRMTSRNGPTVRTIAYLESRGWVVDIAERRQGPVSRDLFGCIDLVAVHPTERRVMFVQVTDRSSVSARVRKTTAQPTTAKLLQAGCDVQVWGWDYEHTEPRVVRIGERAEGDGNKQEV